MYNWMDGVWFNKAVIGCVQELVGAAAFNGGLQAGNSKVTHWFSRKEARSELSEFSGCVISHR